MIRMGRGSRADQQTNDNNYQSQTPETAASNLAYQYTGENLEAARPFDHAARQRDEADALRHLSRAGLIAAGRSQPML